jgi:hypothetical protein
MGSLGGDVPPNPFEAEQVRREPAPQFPLEGGIGPGLTKRRQELGDGDVADGARQALYPRPQARNVLPTPTGPQKMTLHC